MCIVPKAPKINTPAPPSESPRETDAVVQRAAQEQRRRVMAAMGSRSTRMTGTGAAAPMTTGKSLTGQ